MGGQPSIGLWIPNQRKEQPGWRFRALAYCLILADDYATPITMHQIEDVCMMWWRVPAGREAEVQKHSSFTNGRFALTALARTGLVRAGLVRLRKKSLTHPRQQILSDGWIITVAGWNKFFECIGKGLINHGVDGETFEFAVDNAELCRVVGTPTGGGHDTLLIAMERIRRQMDVQDRLKRYYG